MSDSALAHEIAQIQGNEIAILWHINDVSDMRPDLTPDQCREVLKDIKDNLDKDVGVTKFVILFYANKLFPKIRLGANHD